MIIKDKLLFKIEVKKKIDKFVKEFPVHFYGNLIFNLFFVALAIAICVIFVLDIVYSLRTGSNPVFQDIVAYGAFGLFGVLAAFRITFKGFLRNMDILRDMHAGNYAFGIDDHEMDSAIEFIEELPMKKEEIDKLRMSLSFDKLINVLEATKIIANENGEYVMDIVFRYKMIDILDDSSHLKKSSDFESF